MSNLISEHFSEDKQKTAMVFKRGDEYRVTCLNSYFETENEFYFTEIDKAEDFAEDWVL
jgi:hypothetical protein